MKKIIKNIIPRLITIVVIVIVLPVSYWFYGKGKVTKSDTVKGSLADISQLSQIIEQRWLLGDIDGTFGKEAFQCTNLLNNSSLISGEFLRCNPLYMQCFLTQISPAIKTNNSIFKINSKFSYSKKGDLQFTLKSNVTEISFSLKRICHRSLVKKSIYSAGPKNIHEPWDNEATNIYVDKSPVSLLDIYLWKIRNGEATKITQKEYHKNALNIKREEQKKFCRDHGKILLQSHVFDAISYFPTRSNLFFKSETPWTKSSRTFLKSEEKVTELDCVNAYVKECQKFKLKAYSSRGISWSGVNQILGYSMESLDNKFISDANLKVSSRYLERSSNWHTNGRRGYWDGKGFRFENFDFTDQYSEDSLENNFEKYEVVFRCMQID